MADAAVPDRECAVLEIGPGFGTLTRELCARGKTVRAVETDRRLEPVLRETLGDLDNVSVIWGDFLKMPLEELLAREFGGQRVCVCANLPYYITTPVFTRLIESEAPIERVTVMVQREVAERLCARPGAREAGAVTAAVAFRGRAEILFDVPRGAFWPEPQVDSAVVRYTPSERPLCTPRQLEGVLRITRAGFSQRRKTALNSLSAGLSLPKSQVARALSDCGLPENVRVEQLDMDALLALSSFLLPDIC